MPERSYRYQHPDQLAFDQRIAALRRRGWSFAEIGREVGVTENVVRGALRRIRGAFGEGVLRV